jgi:hypothetical protein
MTFEKLSNLYFNLYGPPEEELKYTHESKNYVEWLWWLQGTIVTFSCPENEETEGWEVEEAHYFHPSIREKSEVKEELIRQVVRNYATFMLGSYLTKKGEYTLDWIKRRLWIIGISREDLQNVLEDMRGYGEPAKYERIYSECKKVKFKSKSLFKVKN